MKQGQKMILLPLLFLLCSVSGCTILIFWNPVLGGVEFEDHLEFNQEDIAANVSTSYRTNTLLLFASFHNHRLDTFRIRAADFVMTAGTDTVRGEASVPEDSLLVLAPGKPSRTIAVYFHPDLNKHITLRGPDYFFPPGFQVDLLPVPYRVGNTTNHLPRIGFRPQVKDITGKATRFVN